MSEWNLQLLERGDPRDPLAWERRLEIDRRIAEANQSSEQRAITDLLLSRVRRDGALGFALTGSTARARRTHMSDLDYHVVGRRSDVSDLPADVDVYALEAQRMRSKLLDGDDFIQWTLRFGCVLFDTGAFREAAALVLERDLWPNGEAKLARLDELRKLAIRLISMGDRDAAQDQARAALSSAARGVLLVHRVFPLARGELSGQLREIGMLDLGEALDACIYSEPSLTELERALSVTDRAKPSLAA